MRLLAWTDKKVRAHNAPLLPHKGGGYGTRTVEAVVRFGGRGRQVASGPRPLYDGIYRRHFSVGSPPRSARFVGLPTGKLARGPWPQPAAVAIDHESSFALRLDQQIAGGNGGDLSGTALRKCPRNHRRQAAAGGRLQQGPGCPLGARGWRKLEGIQVLRDLGNRSHATCVADRCDVCQRKTRGPQTDSAASRPRPLAGRQPI